MKEKVKNKIEKIRNRREGITLIALVITIIVLLILAGVAIATLTSENGILKQAEKAKQNTEIMTEKEAVALTITNYNSSNKAQYDIGEKLYDRTIANGDKWNVVMLSESKKVYGNNWNYIGKGVNLENYGETKREWLVNYETGEIIKLEEGEFTKLKYGENLAVKEDIILNADPINMENGTSWGNGVTLYGVQEGDGYGWNGNELKLDGIDDYIEIYPANEINIENGITFEFYGKSNEEKEVSMLAKTNKADNLFTKRFRLLFEDFSKFRLSMSSEDSNSDWKSQAYGNPWIERENVVKLNNEDGAYFTMTANIENNTISIYANGDYVDTTTVGHDWMVNGELTNNAIPFTIGMLIGASPTNGRTEVYSQMDLYACRLYNKVLNGEEIKQNYDKTVTYHNLLKEEKNIL